LNFIPKGISPPNAVEGRLLKQNKTLPYRQQINNAKRVEAINLYHYARMQWRKPSPDDILHTSIDTWGFFAEGFLTFTTEPQSSQSRYYFKTSLKGFNNFKNKPSLKRASSGFIFCNYCRCATFVLKQKTPARAAARNDLAGISHRDFFATDLTESTENISVILNF